MDVCVRVYSVYVQTEQEKLKEGLVLFAFSFCDHGIVFMYLYMGIVIGGNAGGWVGQIHTQWQ